MHSPYSVRASSSDQGMLPWYIISHNVGMEMNVGAWAMHASCSSLPSVVLDQNLTSIVSRYRLRVRDASVVMYVAACPLTM